MVSPTIGTSSIVGTPATTVKLSRSVESTRFVSAPAAVLRSDEYVVVAVLKIACRATSRARSSPATATLERPLLVLEADLGPLRAAARDEEAGPEHEDDERQEHCGDERHTALVGSSGRHVVPHVPQLRIAVSPRAVRLTVPPLTAL